VPACSSRAPTSLITCSTWSIVARRSIASSVSRIDGPARARAEESTITPPTTVRPAGVRRRRLHRTTFAAAGAYNIVWGCYAVLDPQWFFRLTGLPLSNSPQIFACLGMVLGLYGVLYLEVARRPEHGWLVAAVGLTGKILGPLGLAWLIATGVWPYTTVVLVVTNDLIWWVPFGRYLLDAWPHFRATWRSP
jgi:hypothetical protein